MKKREATRTPAGAAVQRWLDENGKSQLWLVDELNRRRGEGGIAERVGRATLWRWLSGKTLVNVDDATLLHQITGTPIALWSRHGDRDAA